MLILPDGKVEEMGNCGESEAIGDGPRPDSYQEMEYGLASLRSLVCDLLQANQELRDALRKKERYLRRVNVFGIVGYQHHEHAAGKL